MASARLFVCPPGKLRSLPQELATSSGGSADLMNFYATTYAVAYGQPWFRPCLGHRTGTGYVANNLSAISHLLCPRSAAEGHCQDTVTSTTAEDFKPLWVPDGRSLLPRHVHQPGSGYHQECAPSCLHPRGDSPQHTGLLQGPPKAAGRHSTKSHCTSPVLPDLLQKTTVGAKEQSGFTRARPRSNVVLPGQPLGISVTTTDYLPYMHSHGGETLPVLPVGSKRGSGFTQEAPSSLGMMSLPVVAHPVSFVSRGLQTPRMTQARLLGQQTVGRKEPSGFTTNHDQYVTPRPTSSPAAPAECWRDPTLTARPVGGIQPQRRSGFSTNNHPTGQGDVVDHPQGAAPHPAWGAQPQW